MTEDEMVGWHHKFNGHELGQFWEMERDRKAWHAAVNGVAEWDVTWQLNNNNNNNNCNSSICSNAGGYLGCLLYVL